MPLPTPPERTTIVLWHHPECSESARVERLLAALPVDITRRSLAEGPPDAAALRAIAAQIGAGVSALLRRDDPLARDLELATADDETLIELMARHERLIQRPLAIVGERAVIARPAELVYRLIAPPLPADEGREAIRRLLRGRR